MEQSNQLLTNANERLDVTEEELVNLEEKLMKANGQFGHLNRELREAKRLIRDLEMSSSVRYHPGIRVGGPAYDESEMVRRKWV